MQKGGHCVNSAVGHVSFHTAEDISWVAAVQHPTRHPSLVGRCQLLRKFVTKCMWRLNATTVGPTITCLHQGLPLKGTLGTIDRATFLVNSWAAHFGQRCANRIVRMVSQLSRSCFIYCFGLVGTQPPLESLLPMIYNHVQLPESCKLVAHSCPPLYHEVCFVTRPGAVLGSQTSQGLWQSACRGKRTGQHLHGCAPPVTASSQLSQTSP